MDDEDDIAQCDARVTGREVEGGVERVVEDDGRLRSLDFPRRSQSDGSKRCDVALVEVHLIFEGNLRARDARKVDGVIAGLVRNLVHEGRVWCNLLENREVLKPDRLVPKGNRKIRRVVRQSEFADDDSPGHIAVLEPSAHCLDNRRIEPRLMQVRVANGVAV